MLNWRCSKTKERLFAKILLTVSVHSPMIGTAFISLIFNDDKSKRKTKGGGIGTCPN